MTIISQTNRAILFEEFNPEVLNLLTLIGDVKDVESLSDEKIAEINKYLLVTNFEEFLTKFSPTVYTFFNNANQKVMYTLKKPEHLPAECVTEIYINQDNDFLKMLITLIDAKRAVGQANVDFKFEKILDMISPKKVMDDIRQVRQEINYLFSEYEKIDEGDPKKLDMGDKLNYKFEEASRNYNNIMAMLPLAIEDIKTRLLLGDSQNGGKAQVFQAGVLTMSENGELKIIEAPTESSTELVALEEGTRNELSTYFAEDYEAITDNPVNHVKELVVRTFSPLPAVANEKIDIALEVSNYNNYLEFYQASKDDFIKTVKPLIEQILGVKMFFDQYQTRSKGMIPTLLVANTSLEMITKSNNLPRLEAYLNTVNMKNDFSNTIWFGIVPNIEIDSISKDKITRKRFKGNDEVVSTDSSTVEALSILLNTVSQYRVQVFFSFKATEETTFNTLATTAIDKYVDRCKPITRKDYSEFAIPCLPNFTIIPRDKSGVILDSRMVNGEVGAQISKEKEDILKLWIEGVYIGAAYVAAGVVAAYQCPEFLKQYFRKVQGPNPGVRFDIEAGNNSLLVVTSMAKEITGFTNNIKDDINRNSFGFVFASENAQFKGKDISRIMVYKARSLGTTEDGYDPIFKTLISTYINRILRFQTNDYKQDNLKFFFSNNPSSQKSKWLNNTENTNSILYPGDDITCEIDERAGRFDVTLNFGGSTRNLVGEISRDKTTG